MRIGSAALLLFLSLGVVAAQHASQGRTEICVYGATPAGIAASVAAAESGHDVILIEPTRRVGGLVTNGLSHRDG